mgnify:CR=1 FL=1
MSKKNGIKLFSKKDGTDFLTDLRALVAKLPTLILQLIIEAKDISEPIIEKAIAVAEAIGNAVEKDTPTGNAFDWFVGQTKFQFDDWFLEWLRTHWREIVLELVDLPDHIQNIHDVTEEYFENLKGMTPKGVNAQQAALASVITQKVNRDVHGVELAGWEADYMVATVFVDGQKALDSAV